MSRNGFIGRAGRLPWRLKEDLVRFKQLTMGHAVIMGRRTHESIGFALKKRRNIVLTRDDGLVLDGCETASSLDEALELAWMNDPEPFVIGGEAVYKLAFPRATRLHLTEVDRDVEGDARFPDFDRFRWRELHRDDHDGFSFVTLEPA